ncbi:MAG: stage II sporulation protein M [Paludibacteraceae bacterium]|nr:stage II sporulation protein M [Paludibacteraceae bacterium]MBR4841101.1 stage II sporulation protein M [Paludibacteraceae bacterium]
MKEITFIRQNKKKWLSQEKQTNNLDELTTDKLSDLYVNLSADYAYSQSQYDNARITKFLSNLVTKTHTYIYRKKKFDFSAILKTFTKDIPETVANAKFEMLVALSIFLVACLIGVILAFQSEENIVNFLGKGYVDMTLENIKNGRPTDVYNQEACNPMFWQIVYNNIKVTFITYAYGIIPFLGSGYILANNGVMLGEFQSLFFLHGVGLESMLSIWMHGAFEIPAIIIAGAAGITLGKGWVLPGTYSRIEALKKSGLQSIKILLSTTPILTIAAFFESYITRHTEWNDLLRLTIILLLFGFIIFYYVYIPFFMKKKQDK